MVRDAFDRLSAGTERLLQRLAAQTGSRDFCPPDLVLARMGTVYVTSNIQPVVWREHPVNARVERLQLEVDSHQSRDFGFTGLTASEDGRTLYAYASSDGALWLLDPSALKATRIAEPAGDAVCHR